MTADKFIEELSEHLAMYPYRNVRVNPIKGTGEQFLFSNGNETILEWLRQCEAEKKFFPFPKDNQSNPVADCLTCLKWYPELPFQETAPKALFNKLYLWLVNIVKINNNEQEVGKLFISAFSDYSLLTKDTKDSIFHLLTSCPNMEVDIGIMERSILNLCWEGFLKNRDKIIEECNMYYELGASFILPKIFSLASPEEVNCDLFFNDINTSSFGEFQNDFIIISATLKKMLFCSDSELVDRYIQYHLFNFVHDARVK